jgi:hypothetical protein
MKQFDPPNLPNAARRHLHAAEMLFADPGHRRDVAGYLYGLAAECAIKEMVTRLRLAPPYEKDKILFAHFPELRTLLRDTLKGRRATPLWAFIFDDAFMNNWHVKMRYADGQKIREEWVEAWQKQAKDAVGAMGT